MAASARVRGPARIHKVTVQARPRGRSGQAVGMKVNPPCRRAQTGVVASRACGRRNTHRVAQRFAGATQDLFLPRSCVVCGGDREWLCERHLGQASANTTGPALERGAGDVRVVSGREYGALERSIVLGYKESGLRSLAAPIADWLVCAIGALTAKDEVLTLVPIPSSVRSRVDRGTDTSLDICSLASARLGERAQVRQILRLRRTWRPVTRQKRLRRSERLNNVANRFVVPTSAGYPGTDGGGNYVFSSRDRLWGCPCYLAGGSTVVSRRSGGGSTVVSRRPGGGSAGCVVVPAGRSG